MRFTVLRQQVKSLYLVCDSLGVGDYYFQGLFFSQIGDTSGFWLDQAANRPQRCTFSRTICADDPITVAGGKLEVRPCEQLGHPSDESRQLGDAPRQQPELWGDRHYRKGDRLLRQRTVKSNG